MQRSATLLSTILLATAVTAADASAQGADDCAMAQPIMGLGPHAFDNTAATPTPGLADCNGLPVRKDVWFAWTAQVDSRIAINVCGQTSLATRIAVYDGTDCNNLALLSCGIDGCPSPPSVSFVATAGQQYLFRVGSQTIGTSGVGTFTLIQTIPILNPNNGSYYEVVDENLSWPAARSRAEGIEWQGRSGELASFTDMAELDWVVQNVALGRVWIGLSQDATNPNYSEPAGGWEWLDGSDTSFTNWFPGEPNNNAANGGAEDFAEMFASGEWNDAEENHTNTTQFLVEWAVPAGSIGMSYCMANPNSTGATATTRAEGSVQITMNDVTLNSEGLPANSFGFYLTSLTQGFVMNPAGSEGNLCLGGSIGRYVGPGQIQQANSAGTFSLGIDLTMMPTPNGFVNVVASQTWNFQAWYRDTVGGMTTSNFTDGVSVTFF